ncbi:MAG TPA: ATP-binding protein [Bacteroidales bacterium]|nr:ATP-binding protein [Bacteroidales bacterium]
MKDLILPENIIERETYTSRIEPFIRKPVIKVLTGQRRVGKSYMLFQLIRRILKEDKEANIIYINKEDIQFDFIQTPADLVKHIKSQSADGKINFIFIDEIQEVAGFEKAVRSLLLDHNNDIYITGSNAKLLSGEFATFLGGRTVENRIYSLSYSEFLHFHKYKDTEENLERFFLYGGLPFLAHLRLTEQIAFEYLQNIYNTIIYRDVVSRYNLRNTYFLEQLVRFLADNTGSLFSSKSISDFLKSQKVMIPHNQVQSYTGYLKDAFLVNRVLRYDIQGKRIFETGEKYYFEDMGIRNAIIGYKPGDRAKILENVVYNELLFRGYDVMTGWKKDHETDFIAIKDNEKIYVQVALSTDNDATFKREFGNLLEIGDNYPKFVVTTDKKSRNTSEGIVHKNIRNFLMEGFV